jgi:UDP-GlcNAc3NAcA epimerase
MKIVTVVGARPQFIKASALSRAIKQTEGLTEVLVNTGQHYDDNMSDVFFRELGIGKPDHNLGIQSKFHGQMTGLQLASIEQVLLAEKPDVLLVYGDTNSTLAGALAAVKMHIPVAHVEAGLRSFNRAMPEEINRVLTDHISSVLYTPTLNAQKLLAREGIAPDKILPVGDIMYDVAVYFGERAQRESGIRQTLGLQHGGYGVATIHRAENTDNRTQLAAIIAALEVLSGQMLIVLPLHPRTRAALKASGLMERLSKNIILIDPLGYMDMTALTAGARIVLTDSGGLQKEAYFHGVPAVTLRTETEWVELIDIGANRLPTSLTVDAIATAVEQALASQVDRTNSPYGQGNTAQAIIRDLLTRFG